MAKINKFWIVLKPTKQSELVDILWQTDIQGMGLQFKGGLKPKEIKGIYTTKKEAEPIAKALLKKRK